MKQAKLTLIGAAIATTISVGAQADTDFQFGGYVKADVMFSDYSNGAPGSGSLSRQFYVPGTIYGDASNGKQVVDFQARESRFNFKTSTDLNGHKLSGFIELDFMTHTDGNERVSNSYSPRIRQAFISFDNWAAGQMWTTFQNPGALPENLDFVGAADGTPFVRQTMVRYTNGGFQFSAENPETTLNTYRDPSGTRVTSGSGMIPDFVARYNMKTESGMAFTFAGIARQLNIEMNKDTANPIDATEFGYGVSFTGVIPVGQDDIKMSATYGEGLGRYMALNYVNAGVLNGNGDIETIGSYGGYISYRHWWNDKWRTSITGSGFKADNNVDLSGNNVNKDSYSGYINLLYSPVKPLTVGVEYMYAKNTKENGMDGELNRVIFSMKYVL
ncbi:DcaP family trimeric outer membrane transporter [Shewanella fidelis]|uniref:DcaP family trimeric outer membrane transporter n=1 Tax=Shewanella fidelis TaxID=173509 RepID=A0AAW8NMW1_9GAMM|nr:DcaP family trimeric outer membrane transporter [Shewanella fidelis]MDR8524227.1 DcaP family trimeric outer membrane transporter [Shewanella fidelis]MDW4810775.1 DcaP family trimeric outer membrane transporter [Shewanella fidelis]MDW4814896.1 DcaP family trimeric outer membrane transporter [Shewanella fidelis]MDW4818986.1 DcaP family trimeric outer membrane transporter [Shewanella fidelis]MDW4823337.1 DcaP family trimeric outer membrane transporter [Shewanella fidelis]